MNDNNIEKSKLFASSLCASTEVVDPKTVRVGDVVFGEGKPVIIAGPCAVESAEQIDTIAAALSKMNVAMLRGGVFKPRTSPYDFQGLGFEGLVYIDDAAKKYNLPFVTEVMEVAHLERVAQYCDMIQIGSRNMYNYPLLRAVGQLGKPVLLKRAFSATLKEWTLAAEYIAAQGNDQIVLCERGIRSFDPCTRNTLDITAVPIMQMNTGLPVIVDPSHATGRSYLVEPVSRAAIAVGADGLLIEVHPEPEKALSDGEQSVRLDQFETIIKSVNQCCRR